jgi:Mlc titration factor MtfA (ptsG expression regulator)
MGSAYLWATWQHQGEPEQFGGSEAMVGWGFNSWRRSRIAKRARIDGALWTTVLDRYSFLSGLSAEEELRLRERVAIFLHDKQIQGAAGLVLDDEMRLTIAVQASILILNLAANWYDGWVEIIVYPAEFVPRCEWQDEFGIVHEGAEPHSGEAWLRGPVVLSWQDIARSNDAGMNVVIHEFAHKLDMLNGSANGCPPLHPGMSQARWSEVFARAYADFCRLVDRNRPTAVDPYAAESPAEFFAVLTEAFFESPEAVLSCYADVYALLAAFYRQDPYARLVAAAA